MRTIATITAVALLSAGAAFASEASGPTGTKKDDEVVCRSTPKAGTRVVNRTCRTRAEWEQITEAARQSFSDMRAGATNTCGGDTQMPCGRYDSGSTPGGPR